jgi:ribosomal-protein-alanine N-acetyltransferase
MMLKTDSIEFGLRQCTYDDIPSVMDINETTLPENYPLFFYEQILEKYPEAFTLAYLKNRPEKIVGYIMWRVERGPSSFGLDYVKKGHLVSLAVLEGYRRLGIAKKIMEHSMAVVQNYGATEYVLEVRCSNINAVRLYHEVYHFSKIKIIHQYYRDGEDAFFMAYRIDPERPQKSGNLGLTDADISRYYKNKDRAYLCYYCPKCEHLMIKGMNYALPGSIDSKDTQILPCAYCNEPLSLYNIASGKYDKK